MESWNQVLNIALLGTEKRNLREADVDGELGEAFLHLSETVKEREEAFLQAASLVYNYRQCGFLPLKKEAAVITGSEKEEKQYCSPAAQSVLISIMETGSVPLVQFWLGCCSIKGRVVQPELIPLLFNTSTKAKSLQALVSECCGKRGQWLQQFNEEWNWSKGPEEDAWQTGSLSQRKNTLSEVRKTNPSEGRELLRQTWEGENAATKVELLQTFGEQAGEGDLQWLEGLMNEKSSKVREAAVSILKTIPSSSLVKNYKGVLEQSVKVNTSKGLLGIGTKTGLDVQLRGMDPELFKTGIQKLSNEKGADDDLYILQQLTSSVPPSFWEEHFGMEKQKIVSLFHKEDKFRAFIPAIGEAAIAFKDAEWLRLIISEDSGFNNVKAFEVFSQKEAEEYARALLTNDETAGLVIQNLYAFKEEWGQAFSKSVIRFTARHPYQFHRGFYNDIADRLPVPFISELEKCTPKEEHLRSAWNNLSEHILKLLTLKLETLKAFNE